MKKTFLKAVALTAAISIGSATTGLAAGGSIGHGDISVYKSGELVSKLSGQNPIEDGSLLVCNGKCMIKSEGISLIGADNARVAVVSEEDTFKLYVKEGRVDYIINSNVRKISFHTPDGTYTVAEVVFNAGNQAVVKGSVVVDSDGKTEIALTEGRMVFATADGMKSVDANSKIVLAVAPTGGAAGTNVDVIVGGGFLAAGAVITIVGINDNDQNGVGAIPAIPATPAVPGTPGTPATPARPAIPAVPPSASPNN